MFHWKPEEIRDTKNMWNLKKRRAWKQESRAGTSLIMVVCVSAFLVAFALAMAYTGSMLMARANRRLKQERCYQLASSFAKVLDKELEKYSGKDLKDPANTGSGYNDSFYEFACNFLEKPVYQEYNENLPEMTTYYYRLTSTDPGVKEKYGEVTIILYKENDQEKSVMEGKVSNPITVSGAPNPLDAAMNNKFSRYTLRVEVVAELDDMTYSYTTAYDTQVQYTEGAVEFTAGGGTIRWDADKWKDIYGNELTTVTDSEVDFKINPSFDRLQTCTFTKTIEEE